MVQNNQFFYNMPMDIVETVSVLISDKIELHGGYSFRPDISGKQNMGIKAFCEQLVFDIGMGRGVPKVVVFPGVLVEVK